MKVYTIWLHPMADADLLRIGAMIRDYAGPEATDRLVQGIVDDIKKLANFPKIGLVREKIAPGLRVIPAGKYRKAEIVYRVNDDIREVEIFVVNYAGGDWQSRVRDRIGDRVQ